MSYTLRDLFFINGYNGGHNKNKIVGISPGAGRKNFYLILYRVRVTAVTFGAVRVFGSVGR